MFECVIAERFVEYYYRNLAYEYDRLRNVYSVDSFVTYHDIEQDVKTFHGKDNIMEGMIAFNLINAVADLHHGSINCLEYSNSEYLVSVTGTLLISERKRQFSHVFVISSLQPSGNRNDSGSEKKKVMIFIKSEILTLLLDKEDMESNEEIEEKKEEVAPLSSPQLLSITESVSQLVKNQFPPSSRPAIGSTGQQRQQRDYAYNPSIKRFIGNRNHGHAHENGNESTPSERTERVNYEIVFIKGVSDNVTEEDLRNVFNRFGEIYQIKLFAEKHYATISYTKENDADHASHHVYDQIREEGELLVNEQSVRIEPFTPNNRKSTYDRNRYGAPKSFSKGYGSN